MEEQMNKKIEKKEKKLSRQLTQQGLLSQADETANKVVENDSILIDDLEESIGTVIKNAAIRKYPIYHLLDSNQQSIVCLGLNSIIDLSAQYPERQTTLFNKKQWKDITNKCPSYTFNDTLYRGVDEAANSVFDLYNPKQSATRNWNLMYQQVISLKGQYNAELNDSFRDIDFCLYFYGSLFMLQKHHEYLFTDDIDNSEWDMIVKFWGPVMERLFTDFAANRASVKGAKYNAASEEKKAELVKSGWTRGTWVPPRRKESAPAPIPSNLVSR